MLIVVVQPHVLVGMKNLHTSRPQCIKKNRNYCLKGLSLFIFETIEEVASFEVEIHDKNTTTMEISALTFLVLHSHDAPVLEPDLSIVIPMGNSVV